MSNTRVPPGNWLIKTNLPQTIIVDNVVMELLGETVTFISCENYISMSNDTSQIKYKRVPKTESAGFPQSF